MLHPSDLYHVGMVVPDVDIAASELEAIGGQQFYDPTTNKRVLTTAAGPLDVEFKVRYSRGPFRLELIRAVPGTLWVAGAALHHLGYWCDDLESGIAELERAGMPMAARSEHWSYHSTAHGYYVEILDRQLRPQMSARWDAAETALARCETDGVDA